eukprot:1921877-Alexandrium_andersonii.AAC.1
MIYRPVPVAPASSDPADDSLENSAGGPFHSPAAGASQTGPADEQRCSSEAARRADPEPGRAGAAGHAGPWGFAVAAAVATGTAGA